MTEFSTSAALETSVDQQSLRNARSEIESGLPDENTVTVSSRLASSGGNTLSVSAASGLMTDGGMVSDLLEVTTDQLAVLEDIEDEVRGSSGLAGGGLFAVGGGLTGALTAKASDVLSLTGTLALAAGKVLAVTGAVSLGASSILAVEGTISKNPSDIIETAGVLTLGAGGVLAVTGTLGLTATGVLAVTGALALPAATVLSITGTTELKVENALNIAGALSVSAAAALAVTGTLTLPAAGVVAVAGVLTIAASEVLEIVDDKITDTTNTPNQTPRQFAESTESQTTAPIPSAVTIDGQKIQLPDEAATNLTGGNFNLTQESISQAVDERQQQRGSGTQISVRSNVEINQEGELSQRELEQRIDEAIKEAKRQTLEKINREMPNSRTRR